MALKKAKSSKEETAQKVNRKKLVEILGELSFALDKRDIGIQSNHFIFTDNRIHVFNGEVYVSLPFKMPFTFSVEGKSFLKLVRSFTEDELYFEVKGEALHLKTANAKAKIPLIAKAAISELASIHDICKGFDWKDLPEQVIEGIKLCGFSTSKDLTRGNYYCVAVFPDRVLSTDDIRLSRYEFNKKLKQTDRWLIPFTYLDLFNKQEYEYYDDKGPRLSFKSKGEMYFSLTKIQGDFLENEEDFFKDPEDLTKFKFPKDVKAYLDLVIGLMEDVLDYDKVIKITATGESIKCIYEGDLLYKERSFDIKGKKVKFNFLINPVFLKQILGIGSAFYIDDENYKIFYYSDSFSHVLSLLYSEEGEK